MSRVKPLGSELQRKGYTKDVVVISCANCGKKVTCKWERNMTPGIHFGRPRIHIPEDWKVMYTMGDTKQEVLCDKCMPQEVTVSPTNPLIYRRTP